MRETRRLAVGAGVVVLLVATGCAQEAGRETADVVTGRPADFAATASYLTKVIDDSSTQSFRYEVAMEMEGLPPEARGMPEMPTMTGAVDGERSSVRMDMGAGLGSAMEDDLPDGLSAQDMVMETVVDGDTMYMRAPFMAAVFEQMPAEAAGLLPEGFDELAGALTDWVSVDLAALGDVAAGDAAGAVTGNQNMDPQVFLDLVRSAETVEDIGSDVIDGVPVTGLATEISMADMAQAGTGPTDEPTTTDEPTDAPADDEGLGGLFDVMADVSIPVEIWIDADGLLRRMRIDHSLGNLTEQMDEAGALSDEFSEEVAEAGDLLDGFGISMTFDFFDYGEPMDIEVPTGAVDMTATFVEMTESMEDLQINLDDLGGD